MITFEHPFEQQLFDLQMQKWDKAYDPEVRLVRSYRGKNGYHSRLSDCMVHEIRASFSYAYDLLRRDAPGDRQRAYDILYRDIPLQDINPSRKTYGIWQYYLEEDLEEMNPPDWNWADFNGKDQLRMLLHCGDALTDDLKMRMKDSVYHACQAIIRRNVGPDYTNISVMGSYVTLIAGEMFGWKDILDYGKQRLQKLYDYNKAAGSFREFNSPCYTFVVMYDLTALQDDVQDPDCKAMAGQLLDMAWETIAIHYHAATGQMAGPHDRAYGMMLSLANKFAIERALDYKIRLIDDYSVFNLTNIEPDPFRQKLRCPRRLIPYFTDSGREQVLDQTFAHGRMAYTYLNPAYTVGSLHLEEAWNQHRNVLGYFGTVQAPVGFNLKCLHDQWDYCSALMATVQDHGRVLTGINFMTDAGDTHCNLDMVKNASISAEDLRLRYLFEGAVGDLTVRQAGPHTFTVESPCGTSLTVDFAYTVFDGRPVSFELVRTETMIGIDAVLYHGPRTVLNFGAMETAAAAVTLEIRQGEPAPAAAVSAAENGSLTTVFHNLKVSVAMKPDTRQNQTAHTRLFRDGQRYAPAF